MKTHVLNLVNMGLASSTCVSTITHKQRCLHLAFVAVSFHHFFSNPAFKEPWFLKSPRSFHKELTNVNIVPITALHLSQNPWCKKIDQLRTYLKEHAINPLDATASLANCHHFKSILSYFGWWTEFLPITIKYSCGSGSFLNLNSKLWLQK